MNNFWNGLYQKWFGKHSNWPCSSTGLEVSPEDERDYVYEPTGINFERVELEGFRSVKNQGSYNSCAAFSSCSIVEFLYGKTSNGKLFDLSEMFLWYNSRTDKGTNTGCFLKEVCRQLLNYGVCLEEQYHYTNSNWKKSPDDRARMTASFIRVGSYERVKFSDLKDCLTDGYPVLFGLPLRSSFRTAGESMDLEDWSGSSLGGHAMVVCGYDGDYYKVRNSWGSSWGLNGYVWLHKDIVETGFDFFLLKPVWDK